MSELSHSTQPSLRRLAIVLLAYIPLTALAIIFFRSVLGLGHSGTQWAMLVFLFVTEIPALFWIFGVYTLVKEERGAGG